MSRPSPPQTTAHWRKRRRNMPPSSNSRPRSMPVGTCRGSRPFLYRICRPRPPRAMRNAGMPARAKWPTRERQAAHWRMTALAPVPASPRRTKCRCRKSLEISMAKGTMRFQADRQGHPVATPGCWTIWRGAGSTLRKIPVGQPYRRASIAQEPELPPRMRSAMTRCLPPSTSGWLPCIGRYGRRRPMYGMLNRCSDPGSWLNAMPAAATWHAWRGSIGSGWTPCRVHERGCLKPPRRLKGAWAIRQGDWRYHPEPIMCRQLRTGAKLRRCSGQGPCVRSAIRWAGVP